MRKAILAMTNTIKNFIQSMEYYIVSIFTTLAIFLLCIFTVILIAFTVTQVSFSIDGLSSWKAMSNWVLITLGFSPNNLSDEKYFSLLASLTGSISVIVTLWFSFLTVFKYIQYKRDLKKRSFIKKNPSMKLVLMI